MNHESNAHFDKNHSEAVRYLDSMFGKLKFYHYLQIAFRLAENSNATQLGREEKRNKDVLLKWYHDNFDVLKPLLDNIVIEDEDHHFYGYKRNEMYNS